MELNETVRLMRSNDYKERFVAEYWQLKNRVERLKELLIKIEAVDLVPVRGNTILEMPAHECPVNLLTQQFRHMLDYLHVLEVRAEIECIDLKKGV